VAGSCEHCNEALGSIKGKEFLDYLSDYQLLKKDSASMELVVEMKFGVSDLIYLAHNMRRLSGQA